MVFGAVLGLFGPAMSGAIRSTPVGARLEALGQAVERAPARVFGEGAGARVGQALTPTFDEAVTENIAQMGISPLTSAMPIPDYLKQPMEEILQEAVTGGRGGVRAAAMAPQAVRGRPNEPAYLAHTAAYLAQMRGMTVDALAALTTRNARRLFALPEASDLT